jgi:amidophosphoribosyltransferase
MHREPPERKEKCGVFGVWGHPLGARLAYLGLYAQQHRGQESAGIAVSNGNAISGTRAWAWSPRSLARVLDELIRGRARGAIGHNRYSTAGGSLACNAQPLHGVVHRGQVALAHNGNLINAMRCAGVRGGGHLFHTTSDTEVIIHLLASPQQQRSPPIPWPPRSGVCRARSAWCSSSPIGSRRCATRGRGGRWCWAMPDREREMDKPYYPSSRARPSRSTCAARRWWREIEPGEIVTISD